jgi:hypothetical protein
VELSSDRLHDAVQSAETGSSTEYASIEETINPVALAVISDCVVARNSKGKSPSHNADAQQPRSFYSMSAVANRIGVFGPRVNFHVESRAGRKHCSDSPL